MARPALEVADIFRDHGPAWREANRGHVSLDQLKVNKRVIYNLLMKAAAETTLAIAADPKRLGARIGITAVLHTWGSALTHHPHVHMIVPGGGISFDGARWVASRSDFLVHVKVLARLFRGKMLAMLMEAHDANQLTFFKTHAGLADKRTFKR